MEEIITDNSVETQKLGEEMAGDFLNGGIICLAGELGSGKTTFTQGFLKGLGVRGPYTSPTFVIMKKYKKQGAVNSEREMGSIYHFDAYRVGADDIVSLGWEEIISDKNNVIIIEWADRIKNIIPKEAAWFEFKWLEESKRKIVIYKF